MTDYSLARSKHTTPEEGRCAMEWAAYIAGEPHTDQPACVSPVLRRFCIAFNDRLDDDERQKLRPYLARTIGTAGDGLDEQRVALCRDWLVREALPEWLDLAGLTDLAARLRATPDVTAEAIVCLLEDVRSEVWRARGEALERLRVKVYERLCRTTAVADAADAAVAAVVAVADVVADADVAAVVAVADVVADVAVVAVADVVADAAAVADAADAAAVAAVAADYWAVRKAVRAAIEKIVREKFQPTIDKHNAKAFELLEAMLPTEAVVLPGPVAIRAREVVGA